MFIAVVRGAEVPWQQVCTHWEGWGKVHGDLIQCRLTMPIGHVVDVFSKYWSYFSEREAQDDEVPEGLYAELREAGYPPLAAMVTEHASLFTALVQESLQTEFTGYVLSSPYEVSPAQPGFFLQSMTALDVVGPSLTVEGRCCEYTAEDRRKMASLQASRM